MQVIRKTWYRFSAKALHNHLTHKLKFPPDTVVAICKQVYDAKQAQRKARIKRSHVYNAWSALIDTAKVEAQRVRVIKAQAKAQGLENKVAAFIAYETCIKETLARLRRVQAAGDHTPMQFVEYLRESTGRVIPNGGLFWADYVKPSDRRNVEALFNALPLPIRGKKKRPFERKVPPSIHACQRAALNAQIDSAEGALVQEMGMGPHSFKREALEADLHKVHHARHILSTKPSTAVLPNRWQALLD